MPPLHLPRPPPLLHPGPRPPSCQRRRRGLEPGGWRLSRPGCEERLSRESRARRPASALQHLCRLVNLRRDVRRPSSVGMVQHHDLSMGGLDVRFVAHLPDAQDLSRLATAHGRLKPLASIATEHRSQARQVLEHVPHPLHSCGRCLRMLERLRIVPHLLGDLQRPARRHCDRGNTEPRHKRTCHACSSGRPAARSQPLRVEEAR
mmetsp:Transcript_35493/g.60850  ORF Transcript_35493/g.60850 Transcript_35493/m.60850 type:complete len:205 (-) Transcript_35493:4-618(-)